jgi:site-specific DNA-methyltransferase (adenine-specific)
MKPYYQDDSVTIYNADCRDVVRELSDIDAVVTDPPYGLSFLDKDWDHEVPGPSYWKLIRKACKPGAYLLSFGGTRTWHRLAAGIEDGGWEVRDCLMWLYGSGMPKSYDIGKGIDKLNGEVGRAHKFTAWLRTTGLRPSKLNKITGTNMGSHYLTSKSQPAIPTSEQWAKIRQHCEEVPTWVDELVQRVEAEREVIDVKTRGPSNATVPPSTEAATLWHGYGTSLKPAWEPVVLAISPLEGSFAENALKHGAGGLNVEDCKIGEDSRRVKAFATPGEHTNYGGFSGTPGKPSYTETTGRWPANLLLDEDSAEDLEAAAPGTARYFYTSKASKSDRGAGNDHPTVKPTDLMLYLLKLIMPPAQSVVLDPFMGSGSTLVAARKFGGLRAVGCDIAVSRLEQGTLF